MLILGDSITLDLGTFVGQALRINLTLLNRVLLKLGLNWILQIALVVIVLVLLLAISIMVEWKLFVHILSMRILLIQSLFLLIFGHLNLLQLVVC